MANQQAQVVVHTMNDMIAAALNAYSLRYHGENYGGPDETEAQMCAAATLAKELRRIREGFENVVAALPIGGPT